MLFLTQNPGDSLLPRPATRVSKFVSILQEGGNDRRHPLTGTTESYQAQG